MKAGKLTPRARKDIAQAINAMQSARDLLADATNLKLPAHIIMERQQTFNERRRELNELLDKHTEA